MKKSETSLSQKCESFLSHQAYLRPSDFGGAERLETLLETLTEKQRQVVLLCLINKLSVGEIAEELAISEQAVYSRVHHAFRRLKENTEYIIN